ncbi:hydroxymethylbilane synthase [Zooshikella harenae]|uniref:Porphobilinogen deaminase n=1 Tax=Zooshikella harenae TaxID=2827238 RepID=A0ABS5Z5Y9_9GAMM|nr:hydroxymethylbilane synthase [Zooshikella harenae]MBU2709475.1 hydroxymethylbilane synthase [Zooshikella harenae]
MKTIRIATRKSALALWQANHVKQQLENVYPEVNVELVAMMSQGDKLLDAPLAKIGGKGLFVKELEKALLSGEADIAVHSMKDVPMEFPEGLCLPVIGQREDPRDAFVSHCASSLNELPQGAVVGTSSLRRQCQLLMHRPDLKVNFLRGNVNTRLGKLDAGEYDAIILAAAGLKRLELEARITDYLSPNNMIPAAGQGALGIECREADTELKNALSVLHDSETAACVTAERAVVTFLKGGCQVPIGAYATLHHDKLSLTAIVAEPDASKVHMSEIEGDISQAKLLGETVAKDLIKQGAGDILQKLLENWTNPLDKK